MHDIYVLTVGPFGREVARRLTALIPSTAVDDVPCGARDLPALPDARALALLAWRPVPVLAALLDRAAFERGVPWLPTVQEHPRLRVGPMVVPPDGPCHDCYERRHRQHARAPRVDLALESHYELNPGSGPAGFLPATALAAAGLVAESLARLARNPSKESGRVVELNVVTQQITVGQVVGVHGCPACGLRRDERSRSFARLLPAVREVLA
jgi:bacteriocin biosynthesis cyclodehydratase domain-containing protein